MTASPALHWHAVARSCDVKKAPSRVIFAGEPVVLFRTASGVSALLDRCPHRFAPLSAGKVQDAQIECPYHGWRFDNEGRCTAIPGLCEALPHLRVKRFHTTEKDGAIFIAATAPDAAPYTHCMGGADIVTRIVRSATTSTLLDVAENILDATHTHFTHKGVLRGLSQARYKVAVEVTGGADWVQASYEGEERQHGLVSTLLEGTRLKTIGRFMAPGIVELEYWGPKGRVLATSFHLRQTGDTTVEGIGWLVGPKERGLGHVKALFFKPLFKIALEQDRKVLAAALANTREGQAPVIGPLDFLRPEIARILSGQPPEAAQTPRRYVIAL